MSIENIKDPATRDALRKLGDGVRGVQSQNSTIFLRNKVLPDAITHTILRDVGSHSHTAIDDLLQLFQNFLDTNVTYVLPAGFRWIACGTFELKAGAQLELADDAVLCVL